MSRPLVLGIAIFCAAIAWAALVYLVRLKRRYSVSVRIVDEDELGKAGL